MSQPSSGINAPNNTGIVTQNQNGNNTTIQGPPRIPLGLYQNGQQVGLVGGASLTPDGKQLVFTNPKIASGTVDFSANMEFQDFVVDCRALSPHSGGQAAFTVSTVIGNVTCPILGKR